jgi:spoIIIJ-associated protein
MTDADTTERDADAEQESPPAAESSEDRLVAEGEIAGDYLEELLDVLDFDGDIDLDVEGDRAVVSIDGGEDLTKLVGSKGEVLDALQELTRLAVHQKTGERSRLMLDIANWRRGRREDLTALGDEVARRVLDSGADERLDPMSPFERKIVHDAVAAVAGVRSESEGAEPARRVVVRPD